MIRINYGVNAQKDPITHTPNCLRNAREYATRPNFMTASRESV